MQPKKQQAIDKVQPKTEKKEPELKIYNMDTIRIQPFDEVMVGHMKSMQEQNNIYAGLRQQEEELRVNLNTIRGAIHELKRMRPEELREIQLPWLNGLRRITPDRRNEVIKANIEAHHSLDIRYKSVVMQRMNRADELGEARLRVLKRLCDVVRYEHNMSWDDLVDILEPKSFNETRVMVRTKDELPTAETVN